MAKKKSSNSGFISVMRPNKSQERKWEIESAISTLKRADEIRKNPSLMRDVKKSVMDLEKSIMGGSLKTKK
jgi:hypothetical protein